MIVKKATRVGVGSGTKQDIINALSRSTVPDRATAVSIEADFSDMLMDGLLTGAIFKTEYVMTFEWEDEE